ncbi:hypothetical protein, partial [Methanoculleus sp. MH98A]|uniref:hypothetical protein n=1 Tax=Methanoculleus sp. MH98A TaxID=1495314 RepID=UPI001E59E3F0
MRNSKEFRGGSPPSPETPPPDAIATTVQLIGFLSSSYCSEVLSKSPFCNRFLFSLLACDKMTVTIPECRQEE